MIRPTTRAVLIFIAGIPLSLLVVIYDSSLWPLSLDYAALALLTMGLDALLALRPGQLNLRVDVPGHLYIGEHGAIAVNLVSAVYRRSLRLELMAEYRGHADPAVIVATRLLSGQPCDLSLPLVPRRRGQIQVDRIWIRWRSPLGLVQFVRNVAVDRIVEVLPNVRGIHGPTLRIYIQEAIYGIKSQRQRGEGAEFESLREFMPGFDTRFIDWKHSARHLKLLCKEFRTERNHQVIVAFDTGHLMLEPVGDLTRLDHAINAGLALAWISLQGGDLVGVYGFDAVPRHYLSPARGVHSFPRIQRAMAGLSYHHQETNFTLGLAELNARLKRRALVILFTDFVDTVTAELLIESLQRTVNRHVVVFVTQRGSILLRAADAPPRTYADVAQAVIAHDFLRDRSIVFQRLERLGVHCLDVPSNSLPVALINRYLLIKQRGLI